MNCFSNLLAVVGGESCESTLTRAAALALANNGSLTVMDVVPSLRRSFFAASGEHPIPELEAEHRERRSQELKRFVADNVPTKIAAKVVVRIGNPAIEIVKQVLSADHDLVVKATDTHSGLQQLLGSVTRSLLRTCPCPVWAIQPTSHPNYRQILAAIDPLADDSEHLELNETIIRLGGALAKREGANLHLVSAWTLPMERTLRSRLGVDACDQLIQQAESRVRQNLDHWLVGHVPNDVTTTLHVLRGRASQQIAETASRIKADLIVMGTICRVGLAGILVGNTAEHLLSTATCDVLAVKPRGFVTPISLVDKHDRT